MLVEDEGVTLAEAVRQLGDWSLSRGMEDSHVSR